MATNKTPISALQETCVKHNCLPTFELIIDGAEGPNNTKIFVYRVSALNLSAEASESSKKLAKHKAAEALLEQLKENDALCVVNGVRVSQPPPADFDAISALTNKCIVNAWPMPIFQLVERTGSPHLPVFTLRCEVGEHVGEGKSSTKKSAKNIASEQVLRLIETAEEAAQTVVPEIIIPPVEDVIGKFRKLTGRAKRKINGKEVRLCNRHRYFESFPDDKIEEARAIICGLHYYEELSDKQKVQMVLDHFEIPHKMSPQILTTGQVLYVFELTGDFDCLFSEWHDEQIWPRVLDYLRTMLNINLYY